MELSTDKILGKVADVAAGIGVKGRHLDIGSGTGALIALLKARLGLSSSACDYTGTLMKVPGQAVEIANLNDDALPYADDSFNLVTCTEVIEHLENYHRILREMFRVARPGGWVILTTPNVLNLLSRTRYLTFGFASLFGPLPVHRAERFSTVGHITPISYFYLAHALAEIGFTDIRLDFDKYQRSSWWRLVLLWPLIAWSSWRGRRLERHRFKTLDASNEAIVMELNSVRMLLGRTIVVAARKP